MPTSTYFIHSFGKSHRLYRMIWLCHMWNENHWCKRWLSCEYLNTSVSVFTYSTCQKCPNICMSIFHPEISSKLYSDFISLCGKKCHKRKFAMYQKARSCTCWMFPMFPALISYSKQMICLKVPLARCFSYFRNINTVHFCQQFQPPKKRHENCSLPYAEKCKMKQLSTFQQQNSYNMADRTLRISYFRMANIKYEDSVLFYSALALT